MKALLAFLGAVACGTAALCQLVSPLELPAAQAAVDLSNYATKADLANKADATALAGKADTSALSGLVTQSAVDASIAASTPSDCPAPKQDALLASPGVLSRCMPRQDAVRATVIQATTAVTAADGTFAGSWPTPFTAAPTGRGAAVDVATSGAAAPYTCSFVAGSVTATSFSGKCWQIVATTLPTTLTAVVGLTVSPLANAAAGLTVRVTGRQ